MEVGLGPGHIVLDEDPALPPQKGAQHRPHFSAMSIMAKRLRIPLGTEVGLGAGDIVLDGDPAPLQRKGAQFVYAVSAIFLLPVWA